MNLKNRWPSLLPVMVSLGWISTAEATPSHFKAQAAEIPTRPSAPPTLFKKAKPEFPQCERYFLYQGKRYECDSPVSKDGARLKSIIQEVPTALAELEIYQKNREKMQITAYTSTAGVAAMLVGILISHPPVDHITGTLKPGGYALVGGLAITLTSLVMGFNAAHANEEHLGKAIRYFNEAHPDRPIEPQFSASFHF